MTAGDGDLAARVARLEAIEDIRVLKAAYCEACDDGYAPDRIAALFTEDATWDGGAMGRPVGRAAIRAFFAEAGSLIPFAIHYVTNPIIAVDGLRATGRWLLWEPVVYHAEGARWMAAGYSDTYARIGSRWFFERVAVDLRILAPYAQGFALDRTAKGTGNAS